MFKEALRPVWAEINLTDLEYNIDRIKEKIGDSKLIGVIKADAYGHGAVKYAQILQKKGCEIFAIAIQGRHHHAGSGSRHVCRYRC